MSRINKFIETIQTDESNWIVVRVKSSYQKYLKHEKANQVIRKILIQSLKEDLVSILIEDNCVKVKVLEGKEEESIEKIKTQLAKHLGNPFKLIKLIR